MDGQVKTLSVLFFLLPPHVQGYRQRNAFMITQGPMENTVEDFWRMVWELKSAAIVMLTQLEEDGEVRRSEQTTFTSRPLPLPPLSLVMSVLSSLPPGDEFEVLV